MMFELEESAFVVSLIYFNVDHFLLLMAINVVPLPPFPPGGGEEVTEGRIVAWMEQHLNVLFLTAGK